MVDALPAPAPAVAVPASPEAAEAPLSREGERLLKYGVAVVVASLVARVVTLLGMMVASMFTSDIGVLGLFGFVGLVPAVALTIVTVIGVRQRKKWGRICAIIFGALRGLSLVANFFGFAFGGSRAGFFFGLLELAVLIAGAFVFLRPEAKQVWSRS
jgi:hypothetical protein